MALIVAGLALLNSLWGQGRVAGEIVSQLLSGTNFKLNAAVVELGMDRSAFAVTNISDRSAVIKSVQCSLYLPIDPRVRFNKAAIKGELEKYRWKETVGMFLVSSYPDEAVQIAAGEQAVVTFYTRHVTPAFGDDRFDTPREPEEFVSSFCAISGVRGNNETIVGGLLLDPKYTTEFDALDLLEIADYSDQRKTEHEELRQKIIRARSAVD